MQSSRFITASLSTEFHDDGKKINFKKYKFLSNRPMPEKIVFRKARLDDLSQIVILLSLDTHGMTREEFSGDIDERYVKAFQKIDADPNQYLMIAESDQNAIGTCHITIMPSLTFIGTTRMQIEAVRVHPDFRGKKIGEKMINEAIQYGKSKGAEIVQLTTNKERPDALRFYERLGFKSTHHGMKLYIDKISRT